MNFTPGCRGCAQVVQNYAYHIVYSTGDALRVRVARKGFAMTPSTETYPIDIAGLHRELPLFEVSAGTRIAVLNVLGDTELVETASRALAQKLEPVDYSVLVTAEAKSIPLVHALSVATGKPYIVLRKNYKPYMGDALKAETLSITTGEPQTLFLDAKDRALVQNAKIVLLDDVISSGSTLQAMRAIMDRAGATVAAEAAILTEGERENWHDIISLGHLPVFTDDAS
ncbi:adenine phosphoribosyltransferase protein [Salinisphaera shabanensis E1L3A]|uniref:Adenine phosphoribosyltransferase protein n=2 Tax=Salinisphaera shabanensis TaxID=180542 RepID=U2EQY2_9GAMM|nr:adenine phosphoribosyltransferase protein [Salinisphaera shabanensis E1L3A]